MTLTSEAAREQMFSRRALFIGAVQGGLGLLLAGRMAYLSIFENEKYQLLAEDNRVSVRLIPPRRGWIVDRNGKPLAVNRPDYRLELIPEQVGDLEATLTELSQLLRLPPDEIARIRDAVQTQPKYLPVSIASGIDWQAFAAVNVRLPEFDGVQPVRGFTRHYPDGPAVGHLLGYVGAPTREQYLDAGKDPLYLHPAFKLGKDGIEKVMDAPLRGQAGARRVEVNARGRIIRELSTVKDTPGAVVKLTIDRDLQAFAARRIGPESASVVVIDVWTGDVLAMVSMPAFDPNSFSDGISHAEWNALMADDHNPLINKTVQGLYPPGSTFKPVTALAALEYGIDPEATVGCRGGYYLGSHRFACWRRGGHGAVNLDKSIFQSCNVYYYTRGREIGVERIAAMARRLGLGQEYAGLSLPSQRDGLVPTPEWKRRRFDAEWQTGETLNTAIGQGYMLTSPLQLAVMTARIASGRAVEPRLVVGDGTPGAALIDVDPAHLARVRFAMGLTVNGPQGTAARSRLPIAEVQMAGKTGTAQVRRLTAATRGANFRSIPWKYRDHGHFIAFAPVDAPRYAISVVVEHGGGGSIAAAPIARDVMTFLFAPEVAMKALEKLEENWNIQRLREQAAARAAADAAAAAAAQPVTSDAQQRDPRPA
jgi:penicillin-binding protein 2